MGEHRHAPFVLNPELVDQGPQAPTAVLRFKEASFESRYPHVRTYEVTNKEALGSNTIQGLVILTKIHQRCLEIHTTVR